jgi:hypothetical protein
MSRREPLDLSVLSQLDCERASAVLANLSIWLSFERLLYLWAEFVTDVEMGYSDSGNEYINELSIRDLIDELLANLPADTAASIKDVVKPLDARFGSATKPSGRVGTGGTPKKDWWFRLPKRVGGQFETDLRDWGLLPRQV